jgi:hypothetical protein
MITQEDVLRKLWNKKKKRRFMHKTRYGREMKEEFCYDHQAHHEEYQRLKKMNDPRVWFRD